MCMFSGEPEKVANTRIFVSLCEPGPLDHLPKRGGATGGDNDSPRWWWPWSTCSPSQDGASSGKDYSTKTSGPELHQITLYSNEVETKTPVAMVLPIPNKECEMIDTSGLDGDAFFRQLNNCFPQYMTRGISKGYGVPRGDLSADNLLQVKRCGSYRYSIVPSLSDFHRVDNGVFKLSPGLRKVLEQHYASDYAFLVCIIDQGAKYKPIAYRHRVMKTAAGPQLFIPTRHHHGDSKSHMGAVEADWDHVIYAAGVHENCLFGHEAIVENALAQSVQRNAVTYGCRRNLPASQFRKQEMRPWHSKVWPNADILLNCAAAA